MDGFTGAWLIAWIIFNTLVYGGLVAIEKVTTPPLPPVIPSHLTDECADRAAQTGKVRFYNKHRGYGYIVPDKAGPNVFVHFNDLESTGIETLQEGQPVGFSIMTTEGKSRAIDFCL